MTCNRSTLNNSPRRCLRNKIVKKINGYTYCGRFRSLEKILQEWIKLHEKFFIQSRDGSWWYNERASIGILAAAAWMAGGIALEEYTAKKKSRKRSGRADVYLNLNGREFACEAKFIWLSVKSPDPIKRIENSLKSARQNVISLNRREGRRFSICFAAVYLPKKDVNKFESLIDKLQQKISSADFEVIAWSFPKAAKNLTYEKSEHFHPGSFIILRNYD